VHALRLLLWAQAAVSALGTLVAVVAYAARGADHLGLGGYAAARTHPAPVLVVGIAATAASAWAARRLPARPAGLRTPLAVLEAVLILDATLGILFGIFNVWLLAGLLTAVAAVWYLRARESTAWLA
jgi:hypothetical protein